MNIKNIKAASKLNDAINCYEEIKEIYNSLVNHENQTRIRVIKNYLECLSDLILISNTSATNEELEILEREKSLLDNELLILSK
jgi:hypothetical protein